MKIPNKIPKSTSGYGEKFFLRTEEGVKEITVAQFLWLLEKNKHYFDSTIKIVDGWIHITLNNF